MTKFTITNPGINNDFSCAKLWYSDEIIIFDNKEQIEEYIREMPMFFSGIRYFFEPIKYHTYKTPYVLYSDLVVDEEFLSEKKNISSKFIIADKDYNVLAKCNKHTIIFDSEKEIDEFIKTFPGLFEDTKFTIGRVCKQLGWYLYMRYEDFKKTDAYDEALGIFG